ncbi:hypothetical protein BDB00DRAFT_758520, partial [Zychaea mexicana]|uniref:uncharacterized protein n=1 Tax=Zychaea mexicana TaxID=64656 RepID=UPI0022FF42F8
MDQGEDVVIKQDALLCKKSLGMHGVGDQPTRYKASRETKQLKEEWRQLQVELTSTTLSLYSSPALIWPSRRLEHRVALNENRDQHLQQRHSCRISNNQTTKKLRLYLQSPLDYTFCIQYPFKSSHDEYVTLTFRGRSVTLSQEWYVALYRVLPDTCKPACSPWCEVNIPLMDLQVRLPLVDKYTNEMRYDITLDSVKSAVLAVLEKDEDWAQNVQSRLGKDNIAMCWTRDNRTEWVYWARSLTDERRHINLVMSPQHIEQTHRLELRRIEHTPTDIIFSDHKSMQEPPPVEGFL